MAQEEEARLNVSSQNKEEIFDDRQLFLRREKHSEEIGILSWGDYIQDMLQTPGKYRTPLTLTEKFTLRLTQYIAKIIQEYGGNLFTFTDHSYPVLPRWQVIINYLFQKKIIAEPRITFEPIFNDEPRLYSLRLFASSTHDHTDGYPHLAGGGYSRGVSDDLDEAVSKVIGELLERYPLTLYRDHDLIRASVKDFKKNGYKFMDPQLLAGFSETQKQKSPDSQFDEQSIFGWIEGTSLPSGKKVFIPAQLVFWNYHRAPDEPFLREPITNGAAGYFSLEGALLSGLYELIQRDAFFIFWLNKITPPRINHSSISNQAIHTLLNTCKRYQLQVEILDITADIGIPTFLVILLDTTHKGPAVSLGGGCGNDAEEAIRRALIEALGVRHWTKSRYKEEQSQELKTIPLPENQEERMMLWSHHIMQEKLAFFLSGPIKPLSTRSFSTRNVDEKGKLSNLIEFLNRRGREYSIFYYQARHPILKKLGYYSVKVVVPALLPLYTHEAHTPLGAKRIREIPSLLGYEPPKDLNQLPHPFP